MYITLKDEGGVLKAVMFKGAASKLNFTPEDGMFVLARGKISVYEQGGSYQLYITEMIPDGVGDLYVAFEQMKKKLEEEGLFDQKYKKPIPKFPECVGVVTASTGAAVRDIINVITRRYPLAKILLYPALVQGQGASESVSKGIELFNRLNNADVLIVGRGGGSIEDLWAFNEERTVRAIFNSKIPVISAVGHETDFTIADFVADLRAPTPSAAAEIAVPSLTELLGAISTDRVRLNNAILRMLDNIKLTVKRLSIKSPEEKYNILRQRIDDMLRTTEVCIKKELLENKKNMSVAVSKLDALSPLKVLSRGFSVAASYDGTVVRSVEDLEKRNEFILTLPDGKAECTANKTYKKELV